MIPHIKYLRIALYACAISLFFCWCNTVPTPTSPTPDVNALKNYFQSILLSLFISTSFILSPAIAVYHIEKQTVRSWLKRPHLSWRNIFLWSICFCFLYVSTYLLYLLLHPTQLQNNITFITHLSNTSWITTLLIGSFMCLIIPFAEELLYRGILMRSFSPTYGLLISTLFFGLAHGINGYLYPILLMGWGLGLIARATHTLWPTILLHCAFNTASFIIALGSNMNGA